MALTSERIYEFLSGRNLAVISTVSTPGLPEAALINYGVTRDLELVLATLQTSRKFANLLLNSHAALVMGWEKECETCQYEGIVDRPDELALPALLETYFAARPEGLSHRGWPDLTYLRVRPRWIRLSKYDGFSWAAEELAFR